MTATLTNPDLVTSPPGAAATPADIEQTSPRSVNRSLWTRLHHEFINLTQTRTASTEYAQWKQHHSWYPATAVELASELSDNHSALGAVVSHYQDGSRLAAALLVEAFRPALIAFTRYARLDPCEQLDRSEVRAQIVLSTFYEVAATTDTRNSSVAIGGRLYGETLKRVTRERPHVPQYPAPSCDDNWTAQSKTSRDPSRNIADYSFFSVTRVDVAPVAARTATIDWDAVERKGLARDVLAVARDNAVITTIEYDILCARFLGDALVPVPTLARQFGRSVSYCETKLRRALLKLAAHYRPGERAAVFGAA
ncbi:hypothetical protein PJN38_24925 [Mycobacterium kansasii]